jgi:hypothetical protein
MKEQQAASLTEALDRDALGRRWRERADAALRTIGQADPGRALRQEEQIAYHALYTRFVKALEVNRLGRVGNG